MLHVISLFKTYLKKNEAVEHFDQLIQVDQKISRQEEWMNEFGYIADQE